MAVASLSVGQVNITDYLMIRARKCSNPTVIAASIPSFIPPAGQINITFPNLEAVPHYIDFRESPDGVAIGNLLATFVYDVKNQQILAEIRYYKVDGGGANDPVSNQDTLTDAYLDGKTIFSVSKDGYGRPMVPPTESYKEYDFVAGGGIKLLNGQVFTQFEVIVIWISYIVNNPGGGGSGSGGGFDGVATINNSTTLSDAYYNKRIKCEALGTRLVITMPQLADIPDGTNFYFTTNKGSQFQTRFITQGGELFEHAGSDVQELSLGKGEYIHYIKYGLRFEVHAAHTNVLNVGQKRSARWIGHLNTLPDNDALKDGDDWPRIWYHIKNDLPADHKIIATDATIAALVRPAGKEALFIISSDSKKFRMPNAQGWAERGLKSFTVYGADGDRTYDYPGGTQPGKVGQHTHPIDIGNGAGGSVMPDYYPADLNTKAATANTSANAVAGENETIMKNQGVIYLTCV